MIDRIHVQPQHSAPVQTRAAGQQCDGGASFGDLFRQEVERTQVQQPSRAITFSKHAMARAEERGIQVDDTLLSQLSDSLEQAQAKGTTNILAFDTNRAFIINVPHGRVITTMSQEEMKENIFTNIDGAVIL